MIRAISELIVQMRQSVLGILRQSQLILHDYRIFKNHDGAFVNK